MVKVNGTKFKVYELDTDESIISRIAVELKTLPKYLWFPEGNTDLRKKKNIQVVDALEFIRTGFSDSTDSSKFLRKFRRRFPELEKNLNLKTDVFEVWLTYNNRLSELEEIGGSIMIDSVGEDFVKNNFFTSLKEFQNFWKNIQPTKKRELETLILSHKDSSDKYSELYQTFENINEGLVYTPLRKEKVIFDIVLNLTDITLMELFNQLLLNEAIPFAYCKNYYKILKDYIPSEEWAIKNKEDDNYIVLKMCQKPNINTLNYKDYTDVVLKVSDTVTASMQLISEKGFLEISDFINRLVTVFYGLGNVQQSRLVEKKIFGIFYFPKEYLNSYVFADLVMNDKNFSNLINIDESKKATKKKGIGSQPLIYIHFSHPNTGPITASIIQKFVDRSDPEMRDQDRDIFTQNDPYIRVRVKGRDTQSVEAFIQIFSKLLVIYNQKYNEIVEFYKQFIPDFGQIQAVFKPDRENDNKLIAPDIFISNYSRKCPNIPEIITQEEAKKYDYQKVMLFPRNVQQDSPHYPSDGKNQQYYVCRNPEFPYPGVQVNKLKNKDHYPFTPCCFRDEQKDKKGRTYNKYFLNEQNEDKEKKQQDFIITNKFVKTNQFGLLPQDLVNFLKLLNPAEDNIYKYVRLGVSDNHEQGKYSFLKSVMYGMYQQTNILDYESKELEQRLLDTLVELSAPDICVMARQSLYDSDSLDISRKINPETYFDPKYYLQLLEGFFNCNIYLFKNTGEETRPTLPRYIDGYYKYSRPDVPSVFIYEHLGSESDSAKHPQCELIIKWKEEDTKDTQYFYNSDSKVITNLNKFLNILHGSYNLDKKLTDIEFSLESEYIKILSQTIDTYGKTRRININYNGSQVSLLTSPIPPIQIRETSNSEISKLPSDIAMKLFSALKAEIHSQTVVDGVLKEINGYIGNVSVTVPVLDDTPLEDLDITVSELHFPENKISVLELYNKNKKLVRYITEYMFWLFSIYIRDNNIQEISDKIIKNFTKQTITIIPDYKYEIVPKTFSTTSKLMSGGKLIISSEEMLKRLLYVLKLYITRNYQTLINYHNQKVILNYYVDITDFTTFPRQVIIQGDDAIDKWLQENKFKYLMYNSVMPSKNIPYFFSNMLVDNGSVFLAQNTQTLDKAIAVSLTWQNQGYNTTINNKSVKGSYENYLHFYGSPDNIQKYKIEGQKIPKTPINILVSKVSDTLFYTALLSFME